MGKKKYIEKMVKEEVRKEGDESEIEKTKEDGGFVMGHARLEDISATKKSDPTDPDGDGGTFSMLAGTPKMMTDLRPFATRGVKKSTRRLIPQLRRSFKSSRQTR